MDLSHFRAEIDRIDNQLVSLFLERMAISAAIGDYKKERGLPVYVPSREKEKLTALEALAPGFEGDIRGLYEKIFQLSRDYQTRRSFPFGVLGRKLGHTYSPQLHGLFGNQAYGVFEREPEDVEGFVKSRSFRGLNVTIPYKKTVLPFCDSLTHAAETLGAVNTLVRQPDGTLLGHNSDYFGFRSLVLRQGISLTGKKALVLGSGGASNTAAAVLKELGARVVVISRTGENNYTNLNRHRDAALIVNATPVGMYPDTEAAPLSLREFPELSCVLDLIYNPARTRLLQEAEDLGIPCENGLWMLVAQAWESAGMFRGETLSPELMESAYRTLRFQTENIVLIGMPGSGKSTVAEALSKQLGRPWVDADRELEKETGISVPEILETQGEESFRALESAVLARLCKQSGLIIATGGGCVTKPENRALLRCNGRVCRLNRDLSLLSTEGRPLSKKHSTEALFRVRDPLYRHFADREIDNGGTPEETVTRILEALQ